MIDLALELLNFLTTLGLGAPGNLPAPENRILVDVSASDRLF